MIERLRERANEPRDIASAAVFRVLFGLLMFAGVWRYFAHGWLDAFYVQPTFTFHYWGFAWVRPLPEPLMTGLFVVIGISALLIAVGLFYRVATVVFFLGFSYLALIDVTRYLNHYYLVILLAAILCVLPLHRAWSLDAWRDPSIRAERLPAWMIWLLRFQVGLVYVFAGIAKLGPDWLLHAQPLGIWLHARTDTPVIGPLLEEPWVAYAMSWAGCLYDLTIVGWLSWRRTRPYAFAVLCGFHFLTNVFFFIGIFPAIMTVVATIFFDPDWPRRLWAKVRRRAPRVAEGAAPPRWRLPRWGAALLGVWVLLQIAVPLRVYLYGGDHLWHEQGMRWGWRVMLHEKNGSVVYRLRFADGRERRVSPSEYLTYAQEREFAAQPDLILQLAHRIRDDWAARGERVEVRADAWASLNGRPSARLIDPEVDLARVSDGLAPADWILPAPDAEPLELRGSGSRLARLR